MQSKNFFENEMNPHATDVMHYGRERQKGVAS